MATNDSPTTPNLDPDAGDTLPVEVLKKRYEASEFAKARPYLLFHDVLDLPVTVDLLVGDGWDPVRKVIAGLRELYGDTLMFTLDGYKPRLTAREWRSEKDLRQAWREFAEYEAKSGGAS